ncbi:MAG: 50S ribosomal protein L13 [Nitrospirae bacterium]|nr:50S ribosomal protein L13 [Nitrospirota bacterium]
MNRTISAKKEDVKRDWYVIDAEGKALGRLASRVAVVLRGKHKTIFTPHVDTGDFVIVINADKVKVTGNKKEDKMYYHHTGYPDGLKTKSLGKFLEERPEDLVKNSVWGMLPKNKLGRAILKKLKVYKSTAHPHTAQMPKALDL